MYDEPQERFLIYETTSEYDKYYSLKYDEERPDKVYVSCFTSICKDQDLNGYERGHRGIDVDCKEFVALRNVVKFNCRDLFASGVNGSGPELFHLRSLNSRSPTFKGVQIGASYTPKHR
jgi:hypothetical protein